jgi:hypothetical protein
VTNFDSDIVWQALSFDKIEKYDGGVEEQQIRQQQRTESNNSNRDQYENRVKSENN